MPDVSASEVRLLKAETIVSDFDFAPQDYINKAVKKYAGNTFILPNPEDPDAEGDPSTTGHQTFFIPKSIGEQQLKPQPNLLKMH